MISELRRARPHGAVLTRLGTVPDDDLRISSVSVGEIQAGIEMTREHDPDKAADIEQWAGSVAAAYNVLPMDAETFRMWGRLMHRRSNTLYEDAMIAATAIRRRLVEVTRNVSDFMDFDVELLHPFEPLGRAPLFASNQTDSMLSGQGGRERSHACTGVGSGTSLFLSTQRHPACGEYGS